MTIVIAFRYGGRHAEEKRRTFCSEGRSAAVTRKSADGGKRRDAHTRARHPRRRTSRGSRALGWASWLARPLLPRRQDTTDERSDRRRSRRPLRRARKDAYRGQDLP